MPDADDTVQRLLEYLERRINLPHREEVRNRHFATTYYEETDRPPLVCYLPYAGDDYQPYPYPETFADPAKMMVNELLVGRTSIYHAVDFPDDAPYCLRANLGCTIVASMFGAKIRLLEDNMPWVEPLDQKTIRRIVDDPPPDPRSGLGQRVIDQFDYFEAALSDYARCQAAFELTFPDLQGPFSTAELLWGSSIYVDLYDNLELVRALLSKITDTMIAAYHLFSEKIREHIGPDCNYHHSAVHRGKLLVKNDSVILISGDMYVEIVQPFDSQLAQALDGISMHFCGNGAHQIGNFLAIPGVKGLDFGQPEKNDLDPIYARAARHQIPLVRIAVPEQELTAQRVKQRFPAGVSLVCRPESLEKAHQIWTRYVSTR